MPVGELIWINGTSYTPSSDRQSYFIEVRRGRGGQNVVEYATRVLAEYRIRRATQPESGFVRISDGYMVLTPSDVVRSWVERFNAADIDGLMNLYAEDAVNHQVVFDEPIRGRDAIRRMFDIEFGRAKMVCNVENLFECGEWAILEWSDPNGLRGCGFFRVKGDVIVFQRGYFDQLAFFKKQGIPVPDTYLG